VNSDFHCIKIIKLWNKDSLVSVTRVLTLCRSVFTATVGLSVEDRYLPLPIQRMLKVVHLAKRESHKLAALKVCDVQQDYQV